MDLVLWSRIAIITGVVIVSLSCLYMLGRIIYLTVKQRPKNQKHPKYLTGRNILATDDSNNVSRLNDGESRDIILPDFDPIELNGNLTESQVKIKKQKERLDKQKLMITKSLFVFTDGVPAEFNDTSIAILTESRNKQQDKRLLSKLWKKFEFDKNEQTKIP